MTEAGILAWLKRQRGTAGLGDDCFILRGSREDLLFTTDMLVEGVHFRRSVPADDIGHRALARGLSDIAAMLAEPRFCLLSLALPPWAHEGFVRRFYGGLLELARSTDCPLSGGDLSHAGQLVADIVVCGAVPSGKAARRDGARPGDWIYVSGLLGGNAADGYMRRIRPRLDLVQELRGSVSACMDVTDGLALDLHRLCEASGVMAHLEIVPAANGATMTQALEGGEDYELLFTSRQSSLPFIRIGQVSEGIPGALMLQGRTLAPRGYDHYRGR